MFLQIGKTFQQRAISSAVFLGKFNRLLGWRSVIKIKLSNMKKLLGFSMFLFLVPFAAFAQTDDQIKASITQQLLSNFVVEVNALDKIQTLAGQSSDPSQFDSFSAMVAQQLSETSAQLANLLGGSAPITDSAAPVQNGSMADNSSTTPSCVVNPVLNVTANRVSTSATVQLYIQYADNCNDTATLLDSNIPWNYTIKDATTGLITANPKLPPVASSFYFPNNPNPIAYWNIGPENGSVVYKGTDDGTANALIITVTVANTTQTIQVPATNNVRAQCGDLSNQIATLRTKAINQESSYSASGMTESVAQGRAQAVAQTEAQQEAPLITQVQQLGC